MPRKANWRVKSAEYNNMCIKLKIDKIRKNKEINDVFIKCEHCGNEINRYKNKICGFCGAKNEHYIKMDSPEEIRNEWELKQKQKNKEMEKWLNEIFKVELNELKRKSEKG